jgi:hypothetical protein
MPLFRAPLPDQTGNSGKFLTTDGTTASWDTVTASGITYSSVNAAGTITTASTTDVVVTGMTITPGAGTYLAMFSTDGSNSLGSNSIVSIYHNAVQVANSERTFAFTIDTIVTDAICTVAAGQAIDVRWRASANTASMGNRILTLIRLS